MASHHSAPVLITGGARRIGLALAKSFLQRNIPVIIAYRSDYPALADLKGLGAICLQADFSTHEGIYRFAEQVKAVAPKLRAVIHNASAWLAESATMPPEQVMASMLQIHVYTPYLLNQLLESCLLGQGQIRGYLRSRAVRLSRFCRLVTRTRH